MATPRKDVLAPRRWSRATSRFNEMPHLRPADVPRVAFEKLDDGRAGESSAVIRARVEVARAIQRARFEGTKLLTNTYMGPGDIQKHCNVDKEGRGLLKTTMAQLHLRPLAYHRILKLARTIADLAGSEGIESPHLAEAIQYRPSQRG